MKLQFINVQIGDMFHTGKDKDGSMLVWKKIGNGQAKCVKVSGRFNSRWIGVVDNFFHFDACWSI